MHGPVIPPARKEVPEDGSPEPSSGRTAQESCPDGSGEPSYRRSFLAEVIASSESGRRRARRGMRGAGLFEQDWSVDSTEFVWQEREPSEDASPPVYRSTTTRPGCAANSHETPTTGAAILGLSRGSPPACSR